MLHDWSLKASNHPACVASERAASKSAWEIAIAPDPRHDLRLYKDVHRECVLAPSSQHSNWYHSNRLQLFAYEDAAELRLAGQLAAASRHGEKSLSIRRAPPLRTPHILALTPAPNRWWSTRRFALIAHRPMEGA